jgi:hypothetical protein
MVRAEMLMKLIPMQMQVFKYRQCARGPWASSLTPRCCFRRSSIKDDIKTSKLSIVEKFKKSPNELQTGRAAFWGGRGTSQTAKLASSRLVRRGKDCFDVEPLPGRLSSMTRF